MDPIEKRESKRKAWMRLAAQRRRAGVLRGRVVAVSLICFLLLWGIVFAQMATGNDPVLSGKEKAVPTRTAATTKGEVETTDPREVEAERGNETRARTREEEDTVEAEAELEAESAAQAELDEAQALEAEAFEEPEPLVTSQS
jgi:hypothetical protein